MNKAIRKIILLALFTGCCATLLLIWTNVQNVQSLNGTSILTGNLFLSALIICIYCISVLCYEKAPKVFFCSGLSALSMLFAVMFSKFEHWGRFANKCAGPYVGLSAVVLLITIYVWLHVKGDKSNE